MSQGINYLMNITSSLKVVSTAALCALSLSSVTAKTKIVPLCISNGQLGHTISAEKQQLMIVTAQIRESAYSAMNIQSETTKERDELLKSKFGNRKCSYVLTLRSNGTIEKIQMKESSGAESTDIQAAEIIRSAAPFRASKLENQVYLIEFPAILVSVLSAEK